MGRILCRMAHTEPPEGISGISKTVQLTLKSLRTLEGKSSLVCSAESPAVTRKAAQKLTNFRAYLHKSSVAACFVDLLEMTNDGIMTESGLYPSNLYQKSRKARRSGFSPSSRSRNMGASARNQSLSPSSAHNNNIAAGNNLPHDFPPPSSALQNKGRRRRRPSTATETQNQAQVSMPILPLTARLPDRFPSMSTKRGRVSFAGRGNVTGEKTGAQGVEGPASRGTDAAGGTMTTLEAQRTHWVGVSKGVLKTASRSRSTTLLRPETDEADVDASESDSCRAKGLSEVADLAMGVSSVVHIKAAMRNAKVKLALTPEQRLANAVRARNLLIEEEKRRAQKQLCKNEMRKKMAEGAASAEASQRGLMEAFTTVIAAKHIWAAGLVLVQLREKQLVQIAAARMIQRSYQSYYRRRLFKVLLSIRRMKLRLHLGVSINRKKLATTKIRWFLTTGNGGAKARPRKVVKVFMYQVRRCQRAAKDWLACRGASVEVICRLWDKIEREIRADLGDELDRAKRRWMKSAARTGEDNHMHGQWRELKAKTRSLVARIDRLELRIAKQQKEDKKNRLLAAKGMLTRRAVATGHDHAAGRSGRRLAHVDSAEALRWSTVPPNKRLAIIRSNLQTKFSLHLQGGRRVERQGTKGVSEMDARMLISGELDTTAEAVGESYSGGGNGGAGSSASATPKHLTRALIYTGDLGRPWQQIVEDAVIRDFRHTAFARKDSMPYLTYSPILSLDILAATGNEQGPTAGAAAAARTLCSASQNAVMKKGSVAASSVNSSSTSVTSALGRRKSTRLKMQSSVLGLGRARGAGAGSQANVLEPIMS